MKFRTSMRLLAAIIICIFVGCYCPIPASASTYTVTNTNNSGTGSLRQAILDTNIDPGLDTIQFNIPGCSGACTIQPTTACPPSVARSTSTV